MNGIKLYVMTGYLLLYKDIKKYHNRETQDLINARVAHMSGPKGFRATTALSSTTLPPLLGRCEGNGEGSA